MEFWKGQELFFLLIALVFMFFLIITILFNIFWLRVGNNLEQAGRELKNAKLRNAGGTILYAWKLRQRLMCIFFTFFVIAGIILKIMHFSEANTFLIIGIMGELFVLVLYLAHHMQKTEIDD